MKIVINIVLILAILGLAYVLYTSIREPIAFDREREIRETAVEERLRKIRSAQELYFEIRGRYSGNFDTLRNVLRNENFMIVKVLGDPDAAEEEQQITYDTIYAPAIDSVRSMEIPLDSLHLVPYGKGATFTITADTLTYQQTKTYVVEVGVLRKKFMGPYADSKYSKYDQYYNPNAIIKFGSLSSPTLSGNWE